jgi:LacI family transcriptional regulator
MDIYEKPYPSVVRTVMIESSYQAVKRIIRWGYRRIAVITGPSSDCYNNERLAGYRRALREAGLTVDENLVKEGNSEAADGFGATMELLTLSAPPTAIFATDNHLTIGIVKALHSHSRCCPEEVAIVGCDDFESVINISAAAFPRR